MPTEQTSASTTEQRSNNNDETAFLHAMLNLVMDAPASPTHPAAWKESPNVFK